MRLSLFKQIWQEYEKHEIIGTSRDIRDANIRLRPIGKVVFEDYRYPGYPLKELPLYSTATENESDFMAIKTIDDEVSIVVHDRALESTPDHLFKCIIAHEVGHWLAGHFDKKPDANNFDELLYNDQRFPELIKDYKRDDSDYNFYRVHRHVLKGLLRGGILKKEIEADYGASKFIPMQDILLIHSCDMMAKNPFASLEKRNRINFISKSFQPYAPHDDGTYFKLEIHFNTGTVL